MGDTAASQAIQDSPPCAASLNTMNVDDVISTHELASRPSRAPDYQSENEALIALAAHLAEAPDTILQKLVDVALQLTGAHSSGISIEDKDGDKDVFRWHATSGEFARYVGGTMPRRFSPCGTVLERKATLLMQDPVKFYPYISQLHKPVREVLLVPFSRNDKLIGTVWVISHTEEKKFEAEDQRLVTSLAHFAAMITKSLMDMNALREADRRQTEFLAMLAHELRNPLTPMRNAVEIMNASIADNEQAKWLHDVMDRQVRHMTHLVEDLMDISRITQGMVILRTQRLDLPAMINAALGAGTFGLDEGGPHLKVSLPDDPLFVEADPTRIVQILQNLIGNAAKYTPADGHIHLEVAKRDDRAVIAVRDSGIGIANEHLPLLFEMFSQLAPGKSRTQGGLGIGLALVKGLVALHGGTVSASSEGEGKGSEFVVELPLGASPAGAVTAPLTHIGHAASRRILIVDDNIDAAATLSVLISTMGQQVRTAHNGSEALQAIDEFTPDIVFLDIGLPDIDGHEVARRVRQRKGPQPQLVALTGWGQQHDREKTKAAGFDHHITKPLEFDKLIDLLALRNT